MLAIWPSTEEAARSNSFADRVWSCFLKALREAGAHTSWTRVSVEYEEACEKFVRALLSLEESSAFASSFRALQQEIAAAGEKNSLSALVMKMGSCGIVDIYQGCEGWKFSHVDPDNRVPVDFSMQRVLLQSPEAKKNWITSQALALRRRKKDLFLYGEYIPLIIKNERVVGWARRHGDDFVFILAGRFFFERKRFIGEVELPWVVDQPLVQLFTNEVVCVRKKSGKSFVRLADVFKKESVAILIPENLVVANSLNGQ